MMNARRTQTGATLLVTLVALVIVTVLALAAIRASSLNLKMAGNVEALSGAEAAAQFVIEGAISNINNFRTPATATVTSPSVGMGARSYVVALAPPRCLNSQTAPGYSLLYSSPPVDQVWNFEASANDRVSGAATTVNQGVKVRLPVGSLCPN
jgi:Tfp pilus assembly protein PilX